MKLYEKILQQLEYDCSLDHQLACDLLIDLSLWKDFKNEKKTQILASIRELKKIFPNLSDEYLCFWKNYYCPILGEFDLYVPYAEATYSDCLIFNNFNVSKDEFSSLLPFGNINNDDYIFLDEKGQVIQFVGIGQENVPPDFFTEVPKDEYDNGWDIAYLPYPDTDGLYRMYMVLAMSFDEFMNECVFGNKYLEIIEKEDIFYKHVQKIKNNLVLDS
jgi:hypothetical protein